MLNGSCPKRRFAIRTGFLAPPEYYQNRGRAVRLAVTAISFSSSAMPSFSPGNSSAAGSSSRRLSTKVLPCQSCSVWEKPCMAVFKESLCIA